jgi:hypothetical protein
MISVIALVVDVCQRSCDGSTHTIRPGIGKPTTSITWPITHSRQSANPRPRRRSSTCQIVIAERRRTMVEKSRRQQLAMREFPRSAKADTSAAWSKCSCTPQLQEPRGCYCRGLLTMMSWRSRYKRLTDSSTKE